MGPRRPPWGAGAAIAGAEAAGAEAAATDDAGGAPPLTIACMTFSGTPAFFSSISASVRVSNFVWLERIFARMTLSENPALTIWMTVSLVMTSCPDAGAVALALARRHAASRRDVKRTCVLNALRKATSTVIWHPAVVEVTDALVIKAIGAAGC